jgi:acetyl-CoA carboxylase biotin carboxyl carrier protein
MDLNYIRRLAKIFDDSKATQMVIEEEGLKIKLSKAPGNLHQYAETSQIYTQNIPINPPAPTYSQVITNAPAINPEATGSIPNEINNIEESQENIHIIYSPIVGTFYRSPAPEEPPFVEVGSHVVKGQTLCIIEAMKLMNDIECDVNGTITKILCQNASPVEFNQPLFHIIPD